MKTLLAVLLLAGHVASGQTLVNFKMPPIQVVNGNYESTTNFFVPTNTTARVLSILASPNVTHGVILVEFPATEPYPIELPDPQVLNVPILGPCTNTITLSFNSGGIGSATFLIQFDTVNTTPVSGMAVVPAGVAATLRLDTSTNLTTWQTVTNASLIATNRNRFFRLSLSVP